jgi:hypothetical protein
MASARAIVDLPVAGKPPITTRTGRIRELFQTWAV